MEIIESGTMGKIDRLNTPYPSILYANLRVDVPEFATAYGYVVRGTTSVDGVQVPAGHAFAAKHSVFGGEFVATMRYGFVGLGVLGVKVEEFGRVQYIDGCTDSVLIPPPRFGDPCLNSLHFPPDIIQTTHTHPSIRAGVIAYGSGYAVVGGEKLPLNTGDAWLIDANEPHHFTTEGTDGMIVIAYHPDSDWGPTDEVHPMKNRTYIK